MTEILRNRKSKIRNRKFSGGGIAKLALGSSSRALLLIHALRAPPVERRSNLRFASTRDVMLSAFFRISALAVREGLTDQLSRPPENQQLTKNA